MARLAVLKDDPPGTEIDGGDGGNKVVDWIYSDFRANPVEKRIIHHEMFGCISTLLSDIPVISVKTASQHQ